MTSVFKEKKKGEITKISIDYGNIMGGPEPLLNSKPLVKQETCVRCKRYAQIAKDVDGFCDNKCSDHYGHYLNHRHPACGEVVYRK